MNNHYCYTCCLLPANPPSPGPPAPKARQEVTRRGYYHGQHTLTAVVVRMDSLFWADRTLMKRWMSICMVMACTVVYSVNSSAILSARLYTSAMLSRPMWMSASVQRPAPPGTSAHVLTSDTAHAKRFSYCLYSCYFPP